MIRLALLLAPYETPAIIAELRGLDVLPVRAGAVGRAGTMLAYCRTREGGEVEPSYEEDCFTVGAPRVAHRLEDGDGNDRSLPVNLRLTRAPDTVPIEGVDGFTTSLQGSWRVLPQGGLQRGSCEIGEY